MPIVFCDIGLSLDGFMAGPNRGPRNPLGDAGVRIHAWVFPTATFRERLGMSGGETGPDDDIVKAGFARAGAYVMGRRMFDEGEVAWPENPPFRAPVIVVTHHAREPWVRQGGTTFTFVTDGIERALAQARAAAGGKDVRISGGADTIRQCLAAGLIDEVTIRLAPVLLGDGVRPFDGLGLDAPRLEQIEVIGSPLVAHVRYRFRR